MGCGNRKVAGAVGIDVSPDSQADIIHDLNSFPYPFPSIEFPGDEFDLSDRHLTPLLAWNPGWQLYPA
jgi:hypothetical protein